MGTPLRVLVLEDSAADYELLRHELKRGGFEPECARVQTAADMQAALAGQSWDIIIADFSMPQFSALDGLKILKESRLDLPFLIISGTIGEDVAVDAMKAGAHDYLMKDKLARLCPAVKRELGEAEVRRQRQRDEEEIRRLNRLYDFLSEVNQTLIRARSRDQFLRDICRIAAEIGGFPLAWIGWHDPETHRVSPVAWAGKSRDYLSQLGLVADRCLEESDPASIAVREEQPSICEDVTTGQTTPAGQGSSGVAGLRVSASFPFRLAGKVAGVLCLYAAETDVFQEREIALLEEVTMDISFGLDRLEAETQRRQAEQELRESEERLRLALVAANQGLFDLDLRYGRAKVSPEYETMLGYSPGELTPDLDWWQAALHPEDRESALRALNACVSGQAPGFQLEFRLRTKAGDWKWILAIGRVVGFSAKGRPARLLGIHTDITQRKQAERQLQEHEEKFRTLFEQAADCIILLEILPDGIPIIRDANQSTSRILGYELSELIGQPVSRLMTNFDNVELIKERRRKILSGEETVFEDTHRCKDGTTRVFECSVKEIHVGAKTFAISVERDITERIQAKKDLIKAAAEWSRTFDTIPDLILVLNQNYQILRVNRALVKALGLSYQEILGRFCYELLDDSPALPEHCPLRQTAADQQEHTRELFLPKLGRYFMITTAPTFDEEGRVSGYVEVMRDITERRQMEAQTVQTEKLASLGVMAGGVAHEINNPIGGIMGIAQLLLMDYPDHGTLTEDLKHIEGAALHCSEIVKNLLTFSRKSGVSAREPVAIPALVDQIMKLIGHQFIHHNLQVRGEFAPDFPVLRINRTQLQQVLINLLINAQQAMAKKGEVFVRGRTLPSREAVIEIEDQGCGIPAAIRDRIFDPFFTTKEQGQGTGLGLSVSYRIIQEHGGRIEVESEEGKGTCMRLVFPPELATTEEVAAEPEAEE